MLLEAGRTALRDKVLVRRSEARKAEVAAVMVKRGGGDGGISIKEEGDGSGRVETRRVGPPVRMRVGLSELQLVKRPATRAEEEAATFDCCWHFDWACRVGRGTTPGREEA
jgi:hypothetical protein